MPDTEIIIVDGGSSDKTFNICKHKNVKVISSKQGKGIQLNEGAKIAGGNILCFLHADTLLPDNTFILLDNYFSVDQNQICRFSLGFDIDAHQLAVRL